MAYLPANIRLDGVAFELGQARDRADEGDLRVTQASRSGPAAGAITLHAEDGWVGVACGGTRFAAGRSVLAGTRVVRWTARPRWPGTETSCSMALQTTA